MKRWSNVYILQAKMFCQLPSFYQGLSFVKVTLKLPCSGYCYILRFSNLFFIFFTYLTRQLKLTSSHKKRVKMTQNMVDRLIMVRLTLLINARMLHSRQKPAHMGVTYPYQIILSPLLGPEEIFWRGLRMWYVACRSCCEGFLIFWSDECSMLSI